jgi:hypothetical protein
VLHCPVPGEPGERQSTTAVPDERDLGVGPVQYAAHGSDVRPAGRPVRLRWFFARKIVHLDLAAIGFQRGSRICPHPAAPAFPVDKGRTSA